MSLHEKHNSEHLRIGEDGERMQGETMIATLRFVKMLVNAFRRQVNNGRQVPDDRIEVRVGQPRPLAEAEREARGAGVEIGDARALESEAYLTPNSSSAYDAAYLEAVESIEERLAIGRKEYESAASPSRKRELYAESQVLGDVAMGFQDRDGEIRAKQQQIQLICYQNEALGRNPTPANRALIRENAQKVAGLRGEIKRGMDRAIGEAAAVRDQLAKAAVGSLARDGLAFSLPLSSNGELASRLMDGNYALTLAAALASPIDGSLSIDGMEVGAPEMTEFGASRTAIRDGRDPLKSKTYFLDTYGELGITQLSDRSGVLVVAKDGRVSFLNLNDGARSFIEALEKAQTARDVSFARESQSRQDGLDGDWSKADRREMAAARKGREIEL